MAITLYRSDDTTLLDGISLTGIEAGADSDTITVHVWNSKGDDTGPDAENVLLVMRTADPDDSTRLLAAGVAPQDEQWGRLRIVGYDNGGEATWSVANTDWQTIGSYAGLLIGEIPADCAVYVEFLIHAPSNADEAPWTWSLLPVYSEYSQPAHPALTRVERGILTGVGDFGRSGLIAGLGVTVSGSPDDEVHSAAGFGLAGGVLYGDIARDHTLNQNDSAAAALASGQHYWAVITRSATGAATATKGLKGTTPAKPAIPTGHKFVKYVRVDYQVGGTSVIEAADLDGTTVYDRYMATDGGGLNLTIHAGQALGGGTWRFAHGTQTLPLTDATTNYVWQLASGLFDATTDNEPPEDTAIGPLWEVVTAAGAITTITDRRYYAGRTTRIDLFGMLPGGDDAEIDSAVVTEECFLEWPVRVKASDGGSGASAGETTFDVKVNGTTIYTDHATDDQRPTVAYDATGDDLLAVAGYHQVTRLHAGDVIALYVASHPTGGSPVRAKATFSVRSL